MRIVFATGNEHKMVEIREIMREAFSGAVEIVTMTEAGLYVSPEENGESFEENALIKARAVRERLCEEGGEEETIILSDDSGLCVDALNGEPGIYSARYMGYDTPYEVKNQAILDLLSTKEVKGEDRSARFVCAIAAILPDGRELLSRGVMEGQIATSLSGKGGFGYDPVFYLPEMGCTAAELSAEEKNRVSHRGNALREMRDLLSRSLTAGD